MNPFWKDIIATLGPLAGVLIGWFLNEFGQWIRLRRDDRRVLGRVLAELLELYHLKNSLTKAASLVGTSLKLPESAHMELQRIMEHLFGGTLVDFKGLHERYEEALKTISLSNPVLAHRLRSQDQFMPLMRQLREKVLNEKGRPPEPFEMWQKLETIIQSAHSDHLGKLIREVAWGHGLITWYRVRRKIKSGHKIPEEIQPLLDLLSKLTGDQNPQGI